MEGADTVKADVQRGRQASPGTGEVHTTQGFPLDVTNSSRSRG